MTTPHCDDNRDFSGTQGVSSDFFQFRIFSILLPNRQLGLQAHNAIETLGSTLPIIRRNVYTLSSQLRIAPKSGGDRLMRCLTPLLAIAWITPLFADDPADEAKAWQQRRAAEFSAYE